MWWCCGKTSKDALGCKFSKHLIRNDELDEEDIIDLNNSESLKNQKCKCCKETGHIASKCP